MDSIPLQIIFIRSMMFFSAGHAFKFSVEHVPPRHYNIAQNVIDFHKAKIDLKSSLAQNNHVNSNI